MNAFVLVAALLALAVIVPLLIPLLRRRDGQPTSAVLSVALVVMVRFSNCVVARATTSWSRAPLPPWPTLSAGPGICSRTTASGWR